MMTLSDLEDILAERVVVRIVDEGEVKSTEIDSFTLAKMVKEEVARDMGIYGELCNVKISRERVLPIVKKIAYRLGYPVWAAQLQASNMWE